MKNRKRLFLKVLAGVIALTLIGGILFVSNAFVGNPVSAMIANKAIKQYADQHYPALDLELDKAQYNFKDSSYVAKAQSKTSVDTKFSIYYHNGEVGWDEYNDYVLGMFNTLDRFTMEYSSIVQNIIAEELGYENNKTMVNYYKDKYIDTHGIVELDMKFDRTLPLDAEVSIQLNLTDSSSENIAKVFTDAHQAFVDHNCHFSKYDLFAENEGILVTISGVTPVHIESGGLANLIEEARNTSKSVDGISAFIKGEKK